MIDPYAKTQDLKLQSGEFALEARLDRAFDEKSTAGAVVAPPHPLYGGSLTNPVVQVVSEALLEVGLSTLLFNYRGTEGSEGTATDGLDEATTDYAAALHELRKVAAGPIIAAGYSFGAGTALLCARDASPLLGLVLIAPPLGMLRADDLAALTGRVLIVVGDDDEYTPIEELRALLAERTNVTLEVLPGVDHFFHFGGMRALFSAVRDHVRSWL
jgi:alpha/beta superfamily hydrolase